ncbi:MAG TPA: hypothetical protein VHW72_21715 [Candidatus Angelobacter sp.]|nr:hypothetical protein [Candidatus Angelobacter sp.]
MQLIHGNLISSLSRSLERLLTAIVAIYLGTAAAFSQPAQGVPVPQYFGIYAVVDGSLIQLDSQQVAVESYVTVRLGHRNGVGNILQGEAVARSNEARVARFTPSLQIIVYSQSSGSQSPLDTARALHLEALVFVRSVNVDTGWPNNVRRSGIENGWEAGDAPELLGMASGDRAKVLEFRIRPMSGRGDMIIAELTGPLQPGVYSLRLGERNPLVDRGGFLFAVDPIAEGIAARCVDATVKYSMNLSQNTYIPCAGKQPVSLAPPSQPAGKQGTLLLEMFDGSTAGAAYGITYNHGAIFSRAAESRIEYRSGIPRQGTLEWWLKVDDAYRFDNFVLHPHELCGVVFATDVQGGDVTWPGTARVVVCSNGQITLDMAQAKYNEMPHQALTIPASQFRFGEWHALGVSYGSQGQAIMLDGQMLGSASNNAQTLGAAGTYQGPADVPTIGETVSHFWQHRQYSGGFDGAVSKFRSSNNQLDWVLARERPQAGPSATTPVQTPCPAATNTGFSLVLDRQSYRVSKHGVARPQTPPVFFDRTGAQVKDRILLQRLATAVWVHDNIVADPSYRLQPKSQLLLSLIQTSAALQGYQHTQDLVVRGSIELLAATVSDGATANPVHILKAALEAAKPDATEWIGAVAMGGLLRSVDEYRSIEKILSTFSGSEFDVPALEQIYKLYFEGWGLEQTFRPVLVATEPTHWTDLARQALWTTGSEALKVIGSLPEAAPAADVVDKLYSAAQQLQTVGEANALYRQWAEE